MPLLDVSPAPAGTHVDRQMKGELIMKKIWRPAAVVAGVALAATAALGIAGVAGAQEPTPTGDAPGVEQGAPRGNFLERVAEKLGISVDQLKEAIQSAALDAVNEAEANGQITAEQANKARERIESGQGIRGFFERRHDRREHRRDLVRKGIVESAAESMGMTFDELKAELQAGDSIADVAAEQGVSLDTVKSAITTDAEAKLGEAVANGRITQERADELLAKLSEHLDDILNKSKEPPATP